MSTTLKISNDTAEITLEGLLNSNKIEEVANHADKAVAAGVKHIYIDASGVIGVDAAGITGLLNLRAGLLDRGLDMSIRSASSELFATLRLLKIHDLLNIKKSSPAV